MILVRATDGLRLCAGGEYQVIPACSAPRWIEGIRASNPLRQFAARIRLVGVPLQDVDDHMLRRLVRAKLRTGEVVIVRKATAAAVEDDREVELQRMVREIESRTRGKLAYGGRQYKLVSGSRLARVPGRDSYEVVSRRDAATVLGALCQQALGDSVLSKLLAEASTMLTRDWRPPLSADGLVLLRKIMVPQAMRPDTEPALTPSQLALLRKSDWIEIEVVDEEGEPFDGGYDICLPDGTVVKSEFGADGFWGLYAVEPGQCKVALSGLGLDAVPTAPAGAGTASPTSDWPQDPSAPGGSADAPDCPTDPCSDTERPANYIELAILDDSGQPLPHCVLEVSYPDGTAATAESDADGVARIFNSATTGPTTVRILSQEPG